MGQVKLNLYGYVGRDFTTETVRTSLRYIRNTMGITSGDTLMVNTMSHGGFLIEAYGISDAFNEFKKETGAKLTFVNNLITASAAMVIALECADEILGTPNSRFMVHRALASVTANSEGMLEMAKSLADITEPHIQTLMTRLGKTHEEVEAILDEERLFTLTEAINIGLVDGSYLGNIQTDLAKKVQNSLKQEDAIGIYQKYNVSDILDAEIERMEMLARVKELIKI